MRGNTESRPLNIFAVIMPQDEHAAIFQRMQDFYAPEQYHKLRSGAVLLAANSSAEEVARNLNISPRSSSATILPVSTTIPPHGTAPDDVWQWFARQMGRLI
jgi:hypothetical protein